jgi:hypothetical protein
MNGEKTNNIWGMDNTDIYVKPRHKPEKNAEIKYAINHRRIFGSGFLVLCIVKQQNNY